MVLSGHAFSADGMKDNYGVISKLLTIDTNGNVNDIEDKKGSFDISQIEKVDNKYVFHSDTINNGIIINSDGSFGDNFIPHEGLLKNVYTGIYDITSRGDNIYSIVNIGGGGFAPKLMPNENLDGKYMYGFVRKNYKTGVEYTKYLLSDFDAMYFAIVATDDYVFALRRNTIGIVLVQFDLDFNIVKEFDVTAKSPATNTRRSSCITVIDNDTLAFYRGLNGGSLNFFSISEGKITKSLEFPDNDFAPNFIRKFENNYYIFDSTGLIRKYDINLEEYEEYAIDKTPLLHIVEERLSVQDPNRDMSKIKEYIQTNRRMQGIPSAFENLSTYIEQIEFLNGKLYISALTVSSKNPLYILEYDIKNGKLLNEYDIKIPISYYPSGAEVNIEAGNIFHVLR